MNKDLDITKTGPLNYKNLQEQNALNSPALEEIPIELEPFRLPTLTEKLLLGTYDINTNYDLGSTRHDLDLYNISQLEHIKDIRAENQSAINKLGSSLVKGAVTAGTVYVDGTLGLITGLSMAIANSFDLDSADHREGFLGGLSYLWDNEVSNGLLEVNKIVENAIPNYSSDWEDNAPVWKKLGTANFWGEGVLKNMGFMVGAFYSGAAWTKALKAASILGKTSTMGARVTGSLLSATNEARIEANQTVENLRNLETLKLLDAYDKHYNDIINSDLDDASKINNLTILNKNLELEQLNIEDKMAKAGAIDFVSNVPLLMFDDFMLFGKLYSRGFSDAADVAKKIKGGASPLSKFKLILQKGEQLEAQKMSQIAKEGTQYVAKKVTDKEILAKSLKSAVREGNEELAQQMFSNFSGDLYAADGPDAYYNALYNPSAEVKVNKFIPSLVKSFNESYGTGSQWEQFAVGAISSLIGMPTFGKMNNSDNNTYLGKGKTVGLSGGILGEIKSQKATNEEAILTVDALNKVINRLADLKRHFVQTQSFTNAMDGFSEELDKFLYKNAVDNSDFSAIETFSKAGRLDDYLAIIDLDFENLSDEELNKIAATTSKFDAEGKVISGWKTIDGNLMSSTDLNTSEGKDLMRKELAENRDKMKKQVEQYSEAVLRVQGLGNNTFTPEQTQELAWLLWKSELFADRYKDIKKAHNETFNKYISVLNRAEESILHTRENLTLDMAFEDGTNLLELNSHELEVIRTLRNFLSRVQEAATPAYLYYTIDKHPEVKDFIKNENIFNYTQYLAASEVKYSDYTKALLDLIDCRRLATVANQFLERFKEFTENPEKIEKERAIKRDNAEVIAKAKKNINLKTQINGLTISLVVRDILNDASKFDDLDELVDKIDADALIKVKEAKLILDKKNQIQQNLSEKIQQGIIPEETYEDAISLIEKSLSNAESLQEFTDLDRFSYQDIEAIEENLQKAESKFESQEEFDEAILDRIDAARTLLAETFNDIDIDDQELEALPDNLDSLNDIMENIDAEEGIPTLNELEQIKQKENSEEALLLLTVVENFETAVENKAFLTKEETGQVFPIVKDVISEAAVLQKKNITLEETKLAIADTDAIDKLDKIIVNPEKLEIIFNEMISAIDAIFKSSETKDEDSSNVESEEIQMNGADLISEYFEENNSRLIPEKTAGNHAYWKPATTEVPIHFTKGELIPYHDIPEVIASKGTTPEYTRMKATHKYLKSLNAWENAYNAKKGDTVEIIIDPELNTAAAQTVLLLQSNGKIVGDLIAEHDNIAVNQLYLPTFINSVLKEFKIWLDAGNTGKFVFSKKTTIALKLIGKVPYSDVSNMKTLNEIHKITNSEGQQVSVPFKLGIVMDDEGRVLMTPGRRAMDLQSEEETTILPKLRSKIGQPVLLMPTGVSNKAFIPVDITMPRYGLHPNISAKIDAFIDLSLNSITALLKGFEVKWILNLQELLSIPVMHVNIDNANNIKISASAEKNGVQSIIYNGPLSNPDLPNILKTFLIGTPYLISRKYINKTFKNGEDYNTMMGELAIANLPVGGTHTISSWFTINPISEEGTQVLAAPIRNLHDNPLKTSRLFSTYTHVDKNGTRVIKVDNETFEVFDGTTGKKLSGVNSDIYAARTFISVNRGILTVPRDNIVATQWGDFNVKTRKFVDKSISNPIQSFTSDELSNIGDIAVESKLGTSMGTFGKDLLENKTNKEEVFGKESNNISTFTNYSGAAQGGDTIWENIGKEFGLGKQVNYRPEDLKKLTKEQLQEVEEAYQQAVKDLGRTPLKVNTFAGDLVRRDYLQAKAADAIFAISTIVESGQKDPKGYVNKTDKPLVAGGTGYAVQMAINLGKPVYVFDQNKNEWFVWNNNTFEKTETPTLTSKFAGIGTREINANGKQAIRDVYEKTTDAQITPKESIKLGVSELFESNPEVLQKIEISTELLDAQASEKGFISNPKDKKIWAALNDNDKQLLLNAPIIKAKEVLTVLSYNFNFIKKEFTSPQNITELLNPTKYRLKLKNTRIDTINIRKEARWFAKVLPNLNREDRLRIQEGIIKTANNLNAWGQFKDGVITISKGAASGTIYHEAFHAVVSLLLTKSELETMFSEAERMYGNKPYIELEELLAEDFRKYVLFLEKPIIENIVSIFRTLKHIINNIIGKEIYLDNLFYRISRGDLGNSNSIRNSIEEYTPEMKSILNSASRDEDGNLLAPNGKISNLNERQYIQVRTKAFKEWFGDWENNPENASKVVDENGEPKIVYRAGEINNDGTLKTRYKAYYFTPSKGYAEQYSKQENVPINEFFIKANSINDIGNGLTPIIRSDGAKVPKRGLFEMPWNNQDVDIILEGKEAAYSSGEYLVPNMNQIKSATDNIGTFSRDNNDIRYRKIPNTSFETIDSNVVFEPEQIHILGSKQDIEGFKDFVQGKQFQKLTAEEKAKTVEQVTKEHRSITALKDLSAKLAHRIGGTVKFENRTDVDWKAYNQGMESVLNEAYMTPDTPFHEILAHPIIRAIKKSNPELYQSLLKELETGRGKEVLDRVKKDYKYKERKFTNHYRSHILHQLFLGNGFTTEDTPGETTPFSLEEFKKLPEGVVEKVEKNEYLDITTETINIDGVIYEHTFGEDTTEKVTKRELPKYTLEEQHEEAIVTLLGMMAADKLDAKKDATLISKLKELWKQISDFVKSLLKQDGIKIDELPITTTLNDLAEIMAYGNNKIILPGYKVEYSTPLGNKYDTLEEVNNEIRGLADANVEVDLSGVKLKLDKIPERFESPRLGEEFEGWRVWKDKEDKWWEWIEGEEPEIITKERALELWKQLSEFEVFGVKNELTTEKTLHDFVHKNREYEQSREIIEQWKKENNIQYDPEEVYSRGQGFYSSIGAYSNLELDLLLKNLIQHIQDNKKAGGEFTISAFTKPIDKRLKHIEGTGDRVRFVIYPKSEHIKWAAPTDVYSGSVWDASEKVSKDKKSELLGVSFTKAPSLRNIDEVSPNLADIIDNLSHVHNELGIELTTNNFRIEYDDNIDYSTKKLIDNINKILDDKYGKLKKPDLSKKILKSENLYEVRWKHNGNLIIRTTDLQKAKDTVDENSELIEVDPIQQIGKQPTQTRENTTSIKSVKNNLGIVGEKRNRGTYNEIDKGTIVTVEGQNGEYYVESVSDSDGEIGVGITNLFYDLYPVDEFDPDTNPNGQHPLFNVPEKVIKIKEGVKKEYTSQAEINLKVAALKEVARKYPRSLITSKVVPINPNLTDNSEIQYSKVGSKNTWEELFERYQNTKFEYTNLNEENKQYLKDKKITREIYDRMTRLEREILFHCKA